MSRQLNGSAPLHDTAAYRRPCPRWFISRGGGVVVPLIAADELPLDVKLVGVPRGMDLDGAARMEFLGEFLHDGSVYALETPLAEAPAEEFTSGDLDDSTAAETNDDRNIESNIPTRSRPKHNSSYVPHSFGDVHPLYGKKVYCTYWIRTGNCAYVQQDQGCLYKHEMPDLATLEQIGFRGIPRWWRVKQSNPKAALDRPRYGGERVLRSVYDRSATSSDESNAELNDSRSEDGDRSCEDVELDTQAVRSPVKCDNPPSAAATAAATRPVTASVRDGNVTSALDDLIDLSINTASPPSQRNTSDHKISAPTRYHRPSSKTASSHESSNSSLIERRTLSSNSQSAEDVRIKSRHVGESLKRTRTSTRRRDKSDSDDPPLDFDPGPIASPTMYQWGDPPDTAAMSSDRERKLKSRRAKISSKTDKYGNT